MYNVHGTEDSQGIQPFTEHTLSRYYSPNKSITVQTKVLQSKVAKSKQKILHTCTGIHGPEDSPKWQSPNIQTNITVQTFINYSPNKYCSATKVELEKQPKFSTVHILQSKQITVHTLSRLLQSSSFINYGGIIFIL